MMFVPDLLHEYDLGAWKAVFIHLLRILIAQGGNLIQILNQRYVFKNRSIYLDLHCHLLIIYLIDID